MASDAPRRAPEDARAIQQRLDDWRAWAQFVYLGGGPAVGTDDELRQRVCDTHDQEVGHDTIQRLQQAVTQGAREQRRLEKALNESQARIADLSARLVQVEQARDAAVAASAQTGERWRREYERAERLAQALQDVLDQFDAGMFVRNTDSDGCSDWAIKAVKPLSALAKAKAALAAGADPALTPRSEP